MSEKPTKRFTVALDSGDYDALRAFAEAQRPPLSLQYVVRLAVRRFLDQHEDSVLDLKPAETNRHD